MKTGFCLKRGNRFDGEAFVRQRIDMTERACASKELEALRALRHDMTAEGSWLPAHEARYVERTLACIDVLKAPPQ